MVKTKYINLILLFILLTLVFSCSLSKNYKTLSFFFDGVPNIYDTVISEESRTVSMLPDFPESKDDSTLNIFTKVTYHEPYRFQGCNNCHDSKSVGTMISDEPDLCYQCHENYDDTYRFTHGPVGGGFCTACHNPHSSDRKYLLNEEGNKLCIYCHDLDGLSGTDMHREGPDFLCSNCHDPHGGDNRLMLVK